MEKDTKELQNELVSSTDIDQLLADNTSELVSVPLCDLLETYLRKYQKRKKDVIKNSNLDITYGYQIFDGRKKPKREKLLQIAFGFPLTVEEANSLLRAGGSSELYVRCKRDVICMYCLQKRTTLEECDAMLYKAGEDTLSAK